MDRLPTEMLLKVFSSLNVVQLLRADEVCRRWKQVIQAEYWNRLEWIAKETIGYPHDDYVNNLIRLSRRVVQVKGFVDPFRLISANREERVRLLEDVLVDPKAKAELRKATLDFAKKLSPGASFPLGLIQSVVMSHLDVTRKASGRVGLKPEAWNVIAALISQVEGEYGLGERESLQLDAVYINVGKESPFLFQWRKHGHKKRIPLSISPRTTRLSIECLKISLIRAHLFNVNCRNTRETLMRLSAGQLESVEIARIHFTQNWYKGNPFEVILEFHPDRRRFAARELLFILENLEQIERLRPNKLVIAKMNKWFDEGRVKRAEMHMGCDLFQKMKSPVLRCREQVVYYFGGYFSVTILQKALGCVDTFHLSPCAYSGTLAAGVSDAKSNGVLSQLKSLSITGRIAASEVEAILGTIKDSLRSLESLTLGFQTKEGDCPSALFSVADVAVPNGLLPRLTSLECTGLPCLPFIVSVLSQAPNLRRLRIGSKPFRDDSVAAEWINKLLDSVPTCPRLESLHIFMSENEDHMIDDRSVYMFVVENEDHSDDRQRRRRISQANRRRRQKRFAKLADSISAKLETLSEKICHVDVQLDSWQYSSFNGAKGQRRQALVGSRRLPRPQILRINENF